MTEDEMVGWHHRLNGHEFEHAPEVGDGQGSLACCSPWGCRVRHDSKGQGSLEERIWEKWRRFMEDCIFQIWKESDMTEQLN